MLPTCLPQACWAALVTWLSSRACLSGRTKDFGQLPNSSFPLRLPEARGGFSLIFTVTVWWGSYSQSSPKCGGGGQLSQASSFACPSQRLPPAPAPGSCGSQGLPACPSSVAAAPALWPRFSEASERLALLRLLSTIHALQVSDQKLTSLSPLFIHTFWESSNF